MIQLINLTKKFGNSTIFNNVNLTISTCGIHAIVGESGSGKSTLLNILAGYEPTTDGTLKVEGKIATIFQNYELISELNVRDNIYLPLELNKDNFEDAEMIISLLGLASLLDHYPNELSGGQQQRVGIARALFQNPTIILCDEPTESLDQENKKIVMDLLKKLSSKCIIVLVTHDLSIISQYADAIYRIADYSIKAEKENGGIIIPQIVSSPSINIKKVHIYLNKIIIKRTILFSLLISLLTMSLVTLYSIKREMFQEPTTFDAISPNSIYVSVNEELYDFSKLGISASPRIEFLTMEYDKEYYRPLMVAYKPNELSIEGEEPNELEVVINQNLAKKFSHSMIGETITLSYRIKSLERRLEMKVVGVIEESDIDKDALYYNYRGVNAYLESQRVNTTLEDIKTEADWIETFTQYFEIVVPYEKIGEVYAKMESESDLLYESPLYDKRIEEKRQGSMYEITFNIVVALLFVGIVLITVLYGNMDTKKYKKNCSIFITLGVPVNIVKEVYIRTKIYIFTGIFILFMVLHQLVWLLSKGTLSITLYPMISIMLASVYVLYSLVYASSIASLQKDKINDNLKETSE